jgi:heme/copper-type cytochrome/quinol oxidase subunit 2
MSVVDFALRLPGDVDSFTPSVRTEMQSAIAARAGVDPSAVMVTVTSGSVIVGVRILTPTAMATSVQSTMASATSSPSSATLMLASVTGISILVLAVVTPPTIANIPPPPAPSPSPSQPSSLMLSGALAAETSGSMGIIISAIAGVIIGLILVILVLVFVRRRCQRRKGSKAQPDKKGAPTWTVTPMTSASKSGTAEWGVELATPKNV